MVAVLSGSGGSAGSVLRDAGDDGGESGECEEGDFFRYSPAVESPEWPIIEKQQ